MFSEYLDRLRMSGQRHFTLQAIVRDLNVSANAARSGLSRLRKQHKVISPAKGLYIIVPPEHQPHGCIPAEELVPILMDHLGAEYYVGLLSAAAFYGASHQKTFKFQIITNHRIVHPLEFGQVKIEVVTKKVMSGLPVRDFVVSTGYLKVAAPELIAIDLLDYVSRSSGLNHVATVLAELVESIDADKLIALSEKTNSTHQLQRIGYILENVEVINEDKRDELLIRLHAHLSGYMKRYVPLEAKFSGSSYPRCNKWKIIENIEVESDL